MLKKPLLLFTMIALLAAPAAAQDLPRIAVYVTGNVAEDEKTALGTRMLASLINSGRYRGIERSGAFLAEIDKEQATQRSGAIDDGQISELGKRFGVKFVCIAAITPAFGSYQVSARIVDVESAEVVHIGESHSPLRTMDHLTKVSNDVVKAMFAGQPAQPRTAEDVMQDGRERVSAGPAFSLPKSRTFWIGAGLEAAGAGLLIYGLAENGNVTKYDGKGEFSKAKKSVTSRNIAYTIGAAALLGGVSVHIFF